MNTNWLVEEVSNQFDYYNDEFENKLGYQPMIDDIISQIGQEIRILDYGCGGGKVSRRLIERGIAKVIGVDISDVMINKANSHTKKGTSCYKKIQSGKLPFKSELFDAAICCYVFINNTNKIELLKIAKEIFRTLKKGGVFYILDTNPDSTGVKFCSFKNGEPNVEYKDGSTRNVHLDLPNGNIFHIVDTHWHKQTYIDILSETGFVNIDLIERFEKEKIGDTHWAPFVIFRCKKNQ